MAASGPRANKPMNENGGRQSGEEHKAFQTGAAFDTTEPIDLHPPRDHRLTGGPTRHGGDDGCRVASNSTACLRTEAERNRSHGTCSHQECQQNPPSATAERTHSHRTIADRDATQASRATVSSDRSRGSERQVCPVTLW